MTHLHPALVPPLSMGLSEGDLPRLPQHILQVLWRGSAATPAPCSTNLPADPRAEVLHPNLVLGSLRGAVLPHPWCTASPGGKCHNTQTTNHKSIKTHVQDIHNCFNIRKEKKRIFKKNMFHKEVFCNLHWFSLELLNK